MTVAGYKVINGGAKVQDLRGLEHKTLPASRLKFLEKYGLVDKDDFESIQVSRDKVRTEIKALESLLKEKKAPFQILRGVNPHTNFFYRVTKADVIRWKKEMQALDTRDIPKVQTQALAEPLILPSSVKATPSPIVIKAETISQRNKRKNAGFFGLLHRKVS